MKRTILEQTVECKKLVYHSPLPKRTQRTSHYKWQRGGRCKQLDPLEVFWFGLQRVSRKLALEVANTILILWEE